MIINFFTINKRIRIIIQEVLSQSTSLRKKFNSKEKEKNLENQKEENKNIKNKNKIVSNKNELNEGIIYNNKKNNSIKTHKKLNNPKKRLISQNNIFYKKGIKINKNFQQKENIKINKKLITSFNNYNSLNSFNDKLLNKQKRVKNIFNNIIIIESKKSKNKNLALIKGENKEINVINKIIFYLPKKERMKYFNDDELNSLEFKFALEIDFRTYFQFYFSLLKQKHLIIFTFFVRNDYNLFLLKLSLFLLSFSFFFFMNALFFNDDSMHKLYEDEGKYNILYQIPQMLYSTIISQIISSLLEKLSLFQDDMLNLKEKTDIVDMKKEIKRIIKYIKIKSLLLFIFGIILFIAFWYYLSAFCSVYYNTQIPLIKDNFISFFMSMIYPFLLYLIPGIFRFIALRNKNKCMYIISNFVTTIIGIF